VLLDTLAAPREQGREVIYVDNPSRVYTKLGPDLKVYSMHFRRMRKGFSLLF